MALNFPAALRITADVQGSQNLSNLARQLQSLSATSKVAGRDLDKIYNETRKLSQAAGNSISSINNQIKALQALRNEAVIGGRQFNFYTQQLKGLQAQLDKAGGAGAGGGGGGGFMALAGGLKGLAGLAVAGGVTQVVRAIGDASMEAETARVRLKALTDVYGEYNQAQQIAARVASTLRLSTTEATDSFAKLYAGLRPTGVGLKEIETVMIGFGAAARTSGATAQEASSAMTQLKQALVSGRAQGDELRSILENAPALGQAVAEQMTKLGTFGKVTRSQLKDLGAEGKISTDVLIEALKQLGETELPKLKEQFDTGKQAVTDLGTATNKLQVALGDAFGPIAVGLIKGFTAMVNAAADAMERFNKNRNERGENIAINEQAMRNAMKRTYGNENIGGLASFLNPDFRKNFEEERNRLAAEAEKAKAKQQAGPTAAQLQAQKDADREREAARAAAAKAAMEDEVKIRQNAEDKLADAAEDHARELAEFRKQTAKQVADYERDLADQRLALERSIGEARRRIAASDQDRALEAERQRRAAMGLSTEAIDAQKLLNEQTRRFTEENIKIEQQATDRNRDLARKLEEFKVQVADGIGKIQEGYARKVSEILQDAGRKLAEKMEKGAANAAATLSNPGSKGKSDDTYHQPGVGYFSRSDGKFLGKNPPGGAIPGGARTNRTRDPDGEATGWDIVMPGGRGAAVNAPLDLTITGTGFQGSGAGASGRGYGNWVTGEFTLGGKKYELLLGHFDRVDVAPGMKVPAGGTLGTQGITGRTFGTHVTTHVNPRDGASVGDAWNALDAITRIWEGGAPRPVGSARQLIGGSGAAATAPGSFAGEAAGLMAGLTGSVDKTRELSGKDAREQQQANAEKLISDRTAAFGQFTADLDAQAKSVADQLRDQQRINDLIRSGISPETAKVRVDAENTARAGYERLSALRDQLTLDLQGNTFTEENRIKLEKILANTILRQQAQKGIVDGIVAENEKLKQLNETIERNKQLAAGIAGAIGQGLGSAMDVLINGTENWGNSLRQIGATVLKDIARQIMQIMVIQPIVKGLSSGLNSLFNANGNAFDQSGLVPFATGGVVNRPTIFPFANGGGFSMGVMGEAGPEAILPLRRGRNGKLGVQADGGGSTSVTVNVDASGNSQVAGDAGQAAALGRAVSQAVQNELLRQKRPGGLLAA
jgi:tape measure domain-containing protein